MQVIYVDVLLFFNFCVNYFLLRGTAFLTHTPCRIPRCLLSALLGSFSALVILLPPLPLAVNLLIRLGTAAGMNGVLCFGLSRRTMLRQTIWFFCCSMLFAGFLMFLQQSTNSRRIFLGNQCFYLQLSLPVCIFCTLLAYGVLRLWHAVRMRCRHTDVPYRVYIRIGSETRIQTGLADTGNNLVDPYSGLPIIVCSRQAFSDLLPQCQKKQRHYHYVPYGTVSGTSLMPVFQADEVLLQAVQSISDLINIPGIINLDFADVTSIMKDAGYAHMGLGAASGPNKAEEAARMAIASPLLETSINGARGVIVNFLVPPDVDLEDITNASQMIHDAAHPDVNLIWGVAFDEKLEDEIKIVVIATNFDHESGFRIPTPPVDTEVPEDKITEVEPQTEQEPINDDLDISALIDMLNHDRDKRS